MVRTITPLKDLNTAGIFLGSPEVGDWISEIGCRILKPIYKNGDRDELLLRTDVGVDGGKVECTACGFMERKGMYDMPLMIGDDLADALDRIAVEVDSRLGIRGMSTTPVYRSLYGNRVYVLVIRSKEGVLFSNIYDVFGRPVKPEDKMGVALKVRAVIRVDSVFFDDIPRIQFSLVEAEVQNPEVAKEKLL